MPFTEDPRLELLPGRLRIFVRVFISNYFLGFEQSPPILKSKKIHIFIEMGIEMYVCLHKVVQVWGWWFEEVSARHSNAKVLFMVP